MASSDPSQRQSLEVLSTVFLQQRIFRSSMSESPGDGWRPQRGELVGYNGKPYYFQPYGTSCFLYERPEHVGCRDLSTAAVSRYLVVPWTGDPPPLPERDANKLQYIRNFVAALRSVRFDPSDSSEESSGDGGDHKTCAECGKQLVTCAECGERLCPKCDDMEKTSGDGDGDQTGPALLTCFGCRDFASMVRQSKDHNH